jgi:hypothetical protein
MDSLSEMFSKIKLNRTPSLTTDNTSSATLGAKLEPISRPNPDDTVGLPPHPVEHNTPN